VSDGNGVEGTIWPARKQPRKRRVAEIQDQAVAVPLHCETAARTPRLRERATAAEHGDLPHSYRMADRARLHAGAQRSGRRQLVRQACFLAVARVLRAPICRAGPGVGACGACPVFPCLMMPPGCVLRTRG
jgi:hypothetical protein